MKSQMIFLVSVLVSYILYPFILLTKHFQFQQVQAILAQHTF